MEFNGTKFQCLNYGHNYDLKWSYMYTDDNHTYSINDEDNTRDLGIIMSSSGNFIDHINMITKKAKIRCGWIYRSFMRNDIPFMKKLWKTYIQGLIDFGSQVWCPVIISQISQVENVLRHYTDRIKGLENYNYWERLKILKIYSQQRRFERYIINYIWKIKIGMVPNYGINFDTSSRRGTIVKIPNLSSEVKLSVKTLREQSLTYHGGNMFNILPYEIREFIGGVNEFKLLLDEFLATIPDQPHGPGLYPEPINRLTCINSNAIVDWIRHLNIGERRPPIREDDIVIS